jgi:hypothetical protein
LPFDQVYVGAMGAVMLDAEELLHDLFRACEQWVGTDPPRRTKKIILMPPAGNREYPARDRDLQGIG